MAGDQGDIKHPPMLTQYSSYHRCFPADITTEGPVEAPQRPQPLNEAQPDPAWQSPVKFHFEDRALPPESPHSESELAGMAVSLRNGRGFHVRFEDSAAQGRQRRSTRVRSPSPYPLPPYDNSKPEVGHRDPTGIPRQTIPFSWVEQDRERTGVPAKWGRLPFFGFRKTSKTNTKNKNRSESPDEAPATPDDDDYDTEACCSGMSDLVLTEEELLDSTRLEKWLRQPRPYDVRPLS
ncbi:hypothetical protein AAE478_001439 [Parahypoxylon ruwenzoriense]